MKQTLNKQSTGFTQINNKVLNDKKLSWKAKGVYCYIYSKPSDWQFSVKRIALDNAGGIDSTKTAIKELEQLGYLQRIRKSSGRMVYYINYDKKPLVEKPTVGKTHCGKISPISNKDINSNKDNNKGKIKNFADNDVFVGKEKEKEAEKKKKRDKLQALINKQGAGYKGIEKKPIGRNARAFTNRARVKKGKEPIKVDPILKMMLYWKEKYNRALNPLNKTERRAMENLLKYYWQDDPKKKLDYIFSQMNKGYMPAYITPNEFWKNYTRLQLKINNK